jgi:hypothetical protein
MHPGLENREESVCLTDAATEVASPKRSSGEDVATMTRSISAPWTPALLNACCAAREPRAATHTNTDMRPGNEDVHCNTDKGLTLDAAGPAQDASLADPRPAKTVERAQRAQMASVTRTTDMMTAAGKTWYGKRHGRQAVG